MLDAVLIKTLRAILPVVTPLITPKQSPAPKPNVTTYIPSPFVPGKITRKEQRRRLKADIYWPSGQPDNVALPIVVNLHGSGFCFHTHGDDARFCSYAARSLPAIVIDVDYSHAPEHPWPAAVEDVDSAIQFVRHFANENRKQRRRHGASAGTGHKEWMWDPHRVALVGFSSGGNLALIGSTRSEHHGGVAAVVAFYPSTNLDEDPYSKPQLTPLKGAAGGKLPPWLRNILYRLYVPIEKVKDRKQPLISPLYADPASFPSSVTIVTAEQDSLAREARKLADKLGSSSTFRGTVVHWEAPGQGHNWDKMTKQGTEPEKLKDEAYSLTVRRIRDAFAQVAVGYDDAGEQLDEADEEDEADAEEQMSSSVDHRPSGVGTIRSRSSFNTATTTGGRDSLSRPGTIRTPKL
ncbi:Abhydrolase_3 domain-containing protein [Pseudozyma hubeiensis]|nr:Abhydrolase_3 domain-containing protein [Pseudozyma hubeiensis]